jgi:hypothetical protein
MQRQMFKQLLLFEGEKERECKDRCLSNSYFSKGEKGINAEPTDSGRCFREIFACLRLLE